MTPRTTRLLCSLAGASAALAVAGAAAAQEADLETTRTAQALYDKAVHTLDRRDYASACPMLEEVVRLEPRGIGAKITLAECYEGSGKLASASITYELAEAAAVAAGQGERQRKAHDRAVALAPRLAHLTVVVSPELRAVPGLSLQRDGVSVGPAQWGLRLPADSGQHHLVATAPGKARWEQVVAVTDGTETAVTVGALVDGDDGGSGGATRGPLLAGIVVGAVGVPILAVASVFGVMAIGKKNDSTGHCQGNLCDSVGFQLRTDGRTDGNVSSGLFGAGAVLVAAGVTLIAVGVTRPGARTGLSPASPGATGVASAQLLFGPGRAALRGSFW